MRAACEGVLLSQRPRKPAKSVGGTLVFTAGSFFSCRKEPKGAGELPLRLKIGSFEIRSPDFLNACVPHVPLHPSCGKQSGVRGTLTNSKLTIRSLHVPWAANGISNGGVAPKPPCEVSAGVCCIAFGACERYRFCHGPALGRPARMGRRMPPCTACPRPPMGGGGRLAAPVRP